VALGRAIARPFGHGQDGRATRRGRGAWRDTRSYRHATARGRTGMPRHAPGHAVACPYVRFCCYRRVILCSYSSKFSSIPSGKRSRARSWRSSVAIPGEMTLCGRGFVADARVLGVRLRLFYNGRHVAPAAPSPRRGFEGLCYLPRAGKDCRDTATPGCVRRSPSSAWAPKGRTGRSGCITKAARFSLGGTARRTRRTWCPSP
jgi:hypothetical protein